MQSKVIASPEFYLNNLGGILLRHNLSLSYTFDLRPDKFQRENLFNYLSLNIPPDRQRLELCNYADYPNLASYLLRCQKISFHFTMLYDAEQQKYERFYLTDSALHRNINPAQDYFTWLQEYQPNVDLISTHMGIMYESTDTALRKSIVPLNNSSQPLALDTAYANMCRSLYALQDIFNSIWPLKDNILLEPFDYRDRRYYTALAGQQISPYENFGHAEIIQQLVAETGVNLLIDIAHIIITCENLYHTAKLEDIRKYIDTLCSGNYAKIKEIHFGVPYRINGLLEDNTNYLSVNPMFPKYFNKNIKYGLFPTWGTSEFTLSFQLLQHIIQQRNQQCPEAPSLIINFETNTEYLREDLATFARYFEES
jgi:hypothetical protein